MATVSTASLTGKKIAVDSMIFIYLFEGEQKYLERSRTILTLAETGKATIITSIISVIEALSPAKFRDDPLANSEVKKFFEETPNLTVYQVDWSVAQTTSQLRQKYEKLKTPDAIQLATALSYGADMFITNDHRLLQLKGFPIRILTLTVK